MNPAERARLKAAVDAQRRALELRLDTQGRWQKPTYGRHALRQGQRRAGPSA